MASGVRQASWRATSTSLGRGSSWRWEEGEWEREEVGGGMKEGEWKTLFHLVCYVSIDLCNITFPISIETYQYNALWNLSELYFKCTSRPLLMCNTVGSIKACIVTLAFSEQAWFTKILIFFYKTQGSSSFYPQEL